MLRNKTEIIKKIENYIQYNIYNKAIANDIEKTLKVFYTIDKKSLIKYIEMLFESDFEKSVYSPIFIKFLCNIHSDDIVILIDNLFNKIENKELKTLLIENCPNTNNYKIRFFLYKLTDISDYSHQAKLSLLFLGDNTYETDLLIEYTNKLKINIFLPKYLDALSNIQSRRVWRVTSEYIKNTKSEPKVIYRILNHIFLLNDKNSADILIDFYKYYNSKSNIDYNEISDINLNIPFLNQKKESLKKKLLKKIIDKLKKYSYIPQVKNFLNEVLS